MEGVIAAMITGLLALAGTLGGSYFANKRSAALIAYRLEQLEKKVQAHNNLVDRKNRTEAKQNISNHTE